MNKYGQDWGRSKLLRITIFRRAYYGKSASTQVEQIHLPVLAQAIIAIFQTR